MPLREGDRVAWWTLLLMMAANIAVVAYSFGDLHRSVTETQVAVRDISFELRQHDRRIQSLEDMPDNRALLGRTVIPGTVADDTGRGDRR